ncbi:UDP-N-acetylglucosamine--N-acetylmuramyl-(pentapeptide) pyrophosphoryl-undecaprenol N-acetylglucosamine transferase [Sulfurimonas sp. SAG-AH-194-C20]|nr:UDP-N-acetylglucosamine--N-acetylmuramyl-(pentapeptide) pyrophosphoryl-undecaprenol N-acetylglucosamine transferase [Sulfurimonas sp. SAG-AH-194-C20]MDF1878285.1 UDP-N-acetylglucosamine--N-acetylmuramyl-(pentapeptide) pyrophosphoryl-undecaprenol N-acetylglucosamine transferase [Sulfurimonas sp. SAG-AH-194-C20]
MNICITGGGTGGHLMIAEALLEAAIQKGHTAIFIGSTHGQDRKYFEDSSAFKEVHFFETTGVVNQKGLGKLKALFKVFKAFLKSRSVLKSEKIDAVYSVGGFSAAPAAFASLFLRVPLFIHEQNAVYGRLNALLKPFASSFISAYDKDSSIKGYPVKKIFSTTKRVRKELKNIIFLGGSHGAKAINDLALLKAKKLNAMGIHIIHQAGEADFLRVQSAYQNLGIEVELYGFTKEIPALIAKADLAVSRAGASTLWELTTNGCPTLYVPYPYAAGNHQYYNAKFIVDDEMGWCELEGKKLSLALDKILKDIDLDLAKHSSRLLDYSNKDVAIKMINAVEEII